MNQLPHNQSSKDEELLKEIKKLSNGKFGKDIVISGDAQIVLTNLMKIHILVTDRLNRKSWGGVPKGSKKLKCVYCPRYYLTQQTLEEHFDLVHRPTIEALKQTKERISMSKMNEVNRIENIYFVLTEEGVEGTGCKSAREALIEYINLSPATDEWIDKLLEGRTEVDSIIKMSRAEYKEWLKTAIEV